MTDTDAMVGQFAPDFALAGTYGPVRLQDLRGRVVVLYFYPRDNSPGCTTQACDFRDAMGTFRRADAVILGISTDSLESHKKFTAKHQLPFQLLADGEATVARAYGVYKQKTLYGKTNWGIERSTFIIDRDGIVRHVFRRVKVAGHVEQVAGLVALLTS